MASHASGGFVSTLATNKDRFRKTLISDQVYDLLRQAVVEGISHRTTAWSNPRSPGGSA